MSQILEYLDMMLSLLQLLLHRKVISKHMKYQYMTTNKKENKDLEHLEHRKFGILPPGLGSLSSILSQHLFGYDPCELNQSMM